MHTEPEAAINTHTATPLFITEQVFKDMSQTLSYGQI